jgi:hypothetical protein
VTSLRISVDVDARGAFPMLAMATLSPLFEGEVSLAELWASLPEFPPDLALVGPAQRWLALEAVPKNLNESGLDLRTPTHAIVHGVAPEQLPETLARYPTARGVEQTFVRVGPDDGGDSGVVFPNPDGTLRSLPARHGCAGYF